MKPRYVLSMIVALALILTLFPVTALGAENEPEFNIMAGVLLKYNGPGGDVAIPEGVTSIAGAAFYYCDNVTSVTIPEGVTTLQPLAFYHCDNLTSVTIPASVTSIQNIMFRKCPDLTDITVAEGNQTYSSQDGVLFSKDKTLLLHCPEGKSGTYIIPDTVRQVGTSAFYGCEGLTKVVIPEGLTELAENMFMGCYSLTDVNIPSSVTTIGQDAFGGCISLTDIIIPEGVTTIGASAFYHCNSLTNVTIPASVTTIGSGAFSHCDALTGMVIPDTVKTLDGGVFQYCDNLSSVTLPSHLTTIEEGMFSNCKSLTSVTIPAGVTSIGDNAFSSSGLTAVTLPQGLLTIGDRAFAWTPLTSVAIPEGVTKVGEEAFRSCTQLANVSLPSTLTTLGYQAFCLCESLGRVDLPQRATNLGTYLFFGCHNLTAATLPTNLTAIPEAMFEGTGLTHITIPNTVTSIGGRAFQDCRALEEIEIPAGVTTIGDDAFDDCDALTEIVLPPKLTRISSGLLEGCDALTSVTIPDGVIYIGWGAFRDCPALTTIDLPGGLSYVARDAFQGCTSLSGLSVAEGTGGYTSADGVLFCSGGTMLVSCPAGTQGTYTIPEGVSRIEWGAFDANLTSITLPDSLTKLDPGAFYYCSSLMDISVSEDHPGYTSVDGVLFSKDMGTLVCYPRGRTGAYVVPDGVTAIADSAFAQCAGLSEVTLPDTVSSIGQSAFNGCSGLSHVEIPSGITTIEQAVFWECSGLTELHIPDSVTTIRGGAFGRCSGLTDMVVPDSVTTLEWHAFDECTNLQSVTLGSGVTRIMSATFQLCRNLADVTIRGDVTDIEMFAFSQCLVKDVYYGGSEQDWAQVKIDNYEAMNRWLLDANVHYNCTWPGVLTKSLFEVDTAPETYTGSAITKTIASDLVEGTDYTVSYSDNVEVGTAAITFTGQGAYHGVVQYAFRIAPVGGDPVTLPWQVFEVDTQDEVYTGSAITKTITTNLVEGVDYTVSYANNVEVGTATLTIMGMGGYTGGWRYTFQIVEPPIPDPIVLRADMFSVDVGGEVYTGRAITKSISGADGDKALEEGRDYTVTYADNVSVGAATITITGQGDYIGTLSYTFTINPATLALTMFMVDTAPETYTGAPITKTVTSKNLTLGTDYTVEYRNNTEAGVAETVITGKGNYTGTLDLDFLIIRKSLSADMFLVDSSNATYTGSPVTKSIVTDLTLGRDYTATYKNNVSVGTATLTITGVGNYAGTLNYNFLIVNKSQGKVLNRDMFGVDVTPEVYRGSAITKMVSSPDLARGTDYTLTYQNNVSAGIAKIVLTGQGAYTGTVEYTFQIRPKPLTASMLSVSTTKEFYTGSPITKVVIVRDGDQRLTRDVDYTVTYSNNTNLGTATIAISGEGNYEGTEQYTFSIRSTSPQDDDFVYWNGMVTDYRGQGGDVSIPDGVISIPDYVFFPGHVTGVTIPGSVEEISEMAFASSEVSSIQVAEDNANYASQDGVLFNKDKTRLIQCPPEKEGAYAAPEGVAEIGAQGFVNCSKLTKVTLPATLTSIGDGAFNGCGSLTDIYYAGSEAEWDKVAGCLKPAPESGLTIHYNYGLFEAASGQLQGESRSLDWSSTQSGKITVTGELAADETVLAACYDEQGRFLGSERITVDDRTAQMQTGSAQVKLFWLDEALRPLSPSALVWERQ